MKRASPRLRASPAKRASVEEILAEHTPHIRRLAESLRVLIKDVLPEASEIAYPVWHGIGYRHPEAGYVCAIFPQKDDVEVGFEHGAKLNDPEGLLDGGGRQVRYLTIKHARDIPIEALRRFVREAVRMQSLARAPRSSRKRTLKHP